MFDYETLRIIWWALLGALFVGFAITDGYDLGIAALLRVLGKTEDERRVLLETIEPVWEGNQVWLILGAGSIFAAWPLLYAVAFSGFYFAMFLALMALILRPVGFSFREKIDDARWRNLWDVALFVVGTVPPIVFGVAVANLFRGVPFHFDASMRLVYEGSFLALLTPHALAFGVLAWLLFALHGCTWTAVKADESIAVRAMRLGAWLALAVLVLLAVCGLWTVLGLPAYRIIDPVLTDAPSNPMLKQVAIDGSWLDAYRAHSWMWLAPLLAYGGALGAFLMQRGSHARAAFAASTACLAGAVLTAGFALFPFLLPSSSAPNASLTVWDASSSLFTLRMMLAVTSFFLPVIVLYTLWVVRVLRGRITLESIRAHHGGGY
jgi:cytochrome bd ubiquinol oxidase subunit II